MITREQPTGELIMIGQTDHSRLAGQFAAHWGNRDFEPLWPYDSVVRATVHHDFSWLGYEATPLINPETGKPYGFGEAPPDPRRLQDQQWCIDWLAGIDLYSGVLVSKHRTGLSQNRYGTVRHPSGHYNPGRMNPLVRDFVDRNEAWQEEQLRAKDPAQRATFWTNYRLLQVWDLLALYFCCQNPYDEHVEPVPASYQDAPDAGVRLNLTPVSPTQVRIDPYPFDQRPLGITIGCRRLRRSVFPDHDTFIRSYFQADPDLLRYELV